MIEQYALPQWITDMIRDASEDDKQRLRLHGYMLVTGIVMRTGQTDPVTQISTYPFSTMNAIPTDEMKELVTAYIAANWGTSEVQFFTTVKDRRISTEDRAYFHVRFIAAHPSRAKARSEAD